MQDDELPKLSEREVKIYKNFWGRFRSPSQELLACIRSAGLCFVMTSVVASH